jgi:feruloyl-CoA synthase
MTSTAIKGIKSQERSIKTLGEPQIRKLESPIRPIRPVHVAAVRASFKHRENGVVDVRSTEPLADYPDRVTDRLKFWAAQVPDHIFLAQRAASGNWETINYADTWKRVRRLGAGLLQQGLSADRPLMILSGNSIEHGLLALAAMYVGIPYAPIAPSYSLSVREYGALEHVMQDLDPGMVFVQNGSLFAPALRAVLRKNICVVHHGPAPGGFDSIAFGDLVTTEPSAQVAEAKADEANEQTSPDSICKVLYTSGSTGFPKGVITTNRMLCSNQQMLRQVMPCLAEDPPVMCDWLPWNHTFGGSHNFGIALHNGGTLYIDHGKPAADSFAETVRNLREIAPTAYFNVPKGYEMLVANLRADPVLRSNFFSRLQLLFFAAAGLNRRTWDDLRQIAFEACGEEILVVTGLGATESAPFALSTGVEGSSPGWIGLPVPGVDLKLVPVGGRIEARLRGPSITPGYWRRPDLNQAAFDEENYYRMGDALKLVDAAEPQKGFLFDGRLNEDFKLSSGTWVRTGMLRMRLLAHFDGLLQDAVLTAPDRDYVAALLFPALNSCRKLSPNLNQSTSAAEILLLPEVRSAFQERLQSFAAQNTGTSTYIQRALLLDSPPSMEAREITDKGTLNPAAVLKNRAAALERLYQEPSPDDVLCVDKPSKE